MSGRGRRLIHPDPEPSGPEFAGRQLVHGSGTGLARGGRTVSAAFQPRLQRREGGSHPDAVARQQFDQRSGV